MKIKKNLVAATAAVLAAGMALAGCGSSNGGSGDVQKTADGKVKITMWHGFSEADGKTLESIVDDFNKSQDKYEIDAQLQPWSTIGETMVTKVTTGDGPDFVTTGADNGQGWSIDGTFQCVSDFYADKDNGTDEYLDNVVKQITFNIDGKEEKCAVPMGYAPTSVWYNTDMWKAAGLQGISAELYEAASLDGASAWQKFRYITLPALRPTFNYVVIFGLIGSFQVFDQVFILTSGGPARSTETIVYRIYTEAFGNGKLGYASALSYVLLIMTLIVGLIQLYTNNKHEKEEIA